MAGLLQEGVVIQPKLIAAMLVAAPLVLCASGCGGRTQTADPAAAETDEGHDPYEKINRTSFAINRALDRTVLHPAAVAYRGVVPDGVRSHLHNMLSNLGNPAQLANDMLQGRPRKAGDTFMRLILNSTVGIGGVFDVAGKLGYPDHDNDFGLTLAVWGVQGGPYLFLPVLGPSSPRDGIGYGINTTLDPLTWASFGGSATLGVARFGVGALDGRSRVLNDTDAIDKSALDPYATYRSLYQQHRASEVAAARKSDPATVPSWYSGPSPSAVPASARPAPTPQLAPPPSVAP